MTEAEWDRCAEPLVMLKFLRVKGTPWRKDLLFMAACCRTRWPELTDERSRAAVEVTERLADGGAGDREVAAATAALAVCHDDLTGRPRRTPAGYAYNVARNAGRPKDITPGSLWSGYWMDLSGAEHAAQAGILRDIYGSPFRPRPALPDAVLSWNEGAVPRLARAAYEQRVLPEGTLDPEYLGVLCDALEDAGFNDAAALAHLRSPGPHYRGCHVLDAVLSRS